MELVAQLEPEAQVQLEAQVELEAQPELEVLDAAEDVVAGPLELLVLGLLVLPEPLAPELLVLLPERLPALHQDELVVVAEVVDLAVQRGRRSQDCWAK